MTTISVVETKDSVEIILGISAEAIVKAFPEGLVVVPAEDGEGVFLCSHVDTESSTRVARCLDERQGDLIAACVNCMVRNVLDVMAAEQTDGEFDEDQSDDQQ